VPPALLAVPVPATPAVRPAPDSHYAIDMHGDLGHSMHDDHLTVRRMTPEERRKLHAILHNLHHEIHDAMAKARPEIQRAMADLQAHRAELNALKPQVEQAMRDARPQIKQAMAEARKAAADVQIDERVRRHIEHAMRQVEMHMDEHGAARDHDIHDMNEAAPGADEESDTH
jgi:predicted  nucleic acid-binding Zn-ribbon protein